VTSTIVEVIGKGAAKPGERDALAAVALALGGKAPSER